MTTVLSVVASQVMAATTPPAAKFLPPRQPNGPDDMASCSGSVYRSPHCSGNSAILLEAAALIAMAINTATTHYTANFKDT